MDSPTSVHPLSTDLVRASPGHRRRRRLQWVVVALLVVTICGLVARLVFDWPAFPDPVPWEITTAAGDRPGLVGRADVYDCWGNFIDTQHLWRVEVSPELIPAVVQQCRVVERVSAQEMPAAFWRELPYWWRPPATGRARYFASPGFRTDVRGGDGQFYLMAFDEITKILYVWHKNNF